MVANPTKKVDTLSVVDTIKAKRGRKSKKELMASLNMELSIKDTNKNIEKNQSIISLNVSEIQNSQSLILNENNNN